MIVTPLSRWPLLLRITALPHNKVIASARMRTTAFGTAPCTCGDWSARTLQLKDDHFYQGNTAPARLPYLEVLLRSLGLDHQRVGREDHRSRVRQRSCSEAAGSFRTHFDEDLRGTTSVREGFGTRTSSRADSVLQDHGSSQFVNRLQLQPITPPLSSCLRSNHSIGFCCLQHLDGPERKLKGMHEKVSRGFATMNNRE